MDRVKRVIHCDRAYKMGLNGKNITVAVMDTGIAPHLDFDQRILHFEDFCQKKLAAYDDNGHGTHVAGIIGGSGLMSKDKRRAAVKRGGAKGSFCGTKSIGPEGERSYQPCVRGNGLAFTKPGEISGENFKYFSRDDGKCRKK